VAFTDVSTGNPTSWSWTFGDGTTSTSQNPSHVYAAGGSYTVTLTATNLTGSRSANSTITVVPGTAFDGNIVLGSPEASSVLANVFSPDENGLVYLAYGTSSGVYTQQTGTSSLQAATPVVLSMTGLAGNTQYFYRLYYEATGATTYTSTQEYSFQTPRPPGSTFVFDIQGDSHPERLGTQFNPQLYTITLQKAAADIPDFYMTIGDDFSVDTLNPATINDAEVIGRYTLQRPFLGMIGTSAPIFLTNGNHEQAARYLLDGTPNNVAVWAQNARNTLYAEPATDSFYSGNTEQIEYIGLLRNYYAWTWGDALFVVIDPYWESPVCVDEPFGGGPKVSNLWEVTHGNEEYQWLTDTLQQSTAKYKLVFAHHVMGTMRGGIEVAPLYEWGGDNQNGTWGFTTNRPTWPYPLHQLMVDNNVTIFFQGHDHIWVHQQLDGVTYQTLSEPADPFYALYNSDAYLSGDKFPNTGYTRVTVSPTNVKVEYVLTFLPQDQGPGKTTGTVAFSYTVPSP
jgi:PKD repeat protein